MTTKHQLTDEERKNARVRRLHPCDPVPEKGHIIVHVNSLEPRDVEEYYIDEAGEVVRLIYPRQNQWT